MEQSGSKIWLGLGLVAGIAAVVGFILLSNKNDGPGGGGTDSGISGPLPKPKLIASIPCPSKKCKAVAISPDGQLIAMGGGEEVVRLYDVKSKKSLPELKGHSDEVRALCFSPDGKYLISGGADKKAIVWSVDSKKVVKELTGHSDAVLAVDVTSDSKTVHTGSADGKLLTWDLEKGDQIGPAYQAKEPIQSLSASPDGKWVVAVTPKKITVVDRSDPKASRDIDLSEAGRPPAAQQQVLPGTPVDAEFSSDNKTVWFTTNSNQLWRWATSFSDMMPVVDLHGGIVVNCLAMSRDASTVIGGGKEGKIKVWTIKGPGVSPILSTKVSEIHALAISNDGTILVGGGAGDVVEVWQNFKKSP